MSILTTTRMEEIEERHLLVLIENKVPESRDLEYKRDPIGRDDRAKKEFLKDVTAFANTAGGHIVIGMAEADGVAAALPGTDDRPADEEIRRLESILESGVEPRLVGVRMRAVPLSAGGGYALVLRIPASWNPPHRVTFDRWNRFFARNAGSVYELSVEQLRVVFLGGAEWERRLAEFRVERLGRLRTGARGPGLRGTGKLIVHLVPLTAPEGALDLSGLRSNYDAFMPLRASNVTHRFNVEGFLAHSTNMFEGATDAYTQVFRNGRVEIARADYVRDVSRHGMPNAMVAAAVLTRDLLGAVERGLTGAFGLGVNPPVAVMVSLVDAVGSVLIRERFPFGGLEPLDRDALLLEPVVLQDGDMAAGWQEVLRPVFDGLWNAYGYPRCSDLFDDDGRWTGLPAAWT